MLSPLWRGRGEAAVPVLAWGMAEDGHLWPREVAGRGTPWGHSGMAPSVSCRSVTDRTSLGRDSALGATAKSPWQPVSPQPHVGAGGCGWGLLAARLNSGIFIHLGRGQVLNACSEASLKGAEPLCPLLPYLLHQ